MTAVLERPPLSQEEFMALQFEGGGYEYVFGELVPLMSVEGRQSTAWTYFIGHLFGHVMAHQLGLVRIDVLTYLDEAGLVRYFPDIVYLAHDSPGYFDGTKVVGAPTLAVEVTSPKSDKREEAEKKDNYHRFGVEWYWVVNTKTSVTEEYHSAPNGYELVSRTAFTKPFRPQLFPGLEITISE